MNSGLIVKKTESKEFTVVPEDVYTAQCVQIWDLGTQRGEYQGVAYARRRINIVFELLDYVNPDNEDGIKLIGQEFTMSFNENGKLLPFLESWRGRKFTEQELEGFDIANVLGTLANLQILHKVSKKGITFAEIGSIQRFKGNIDLECKTQLELYSIPRDGLKIPDSMPKFLRDKLELSDEYKELVEAIEL